MNHIYKTIFNKHTGEIQVTSEIARSGKKHSSSTQKNMCLASIITGVMIGFSTPTFAACVNDNSTGKLVTTCTDYSTTYQSASPNQTLIYEGTSTQSGSSLGTIYLKGNLEGFSFINNGTMNWNNAEYYQPGSGGTRSLVNAYTWGLGIAGSYRLVNNGKMIVDSTYNIPSSHSLAGMSAYSTSKDSEIAWENHGLLQIKSNSNTLQSTINGGIAQATAKVMAINSGEINAQHLGTSYYIEGLDITLLGLTTDTTHQSAEASFTNTGLLYVSAPNTIDQSYGMTFYQSGANVSKLPSNFKLDNSGKIFLDVDNTKAIAVHLQSNNYSNVFYEINNSGEILAKNRNASAIVHSATNTDQSSNVVLNNTGTIVGKITTNSGHDQITQTSGSIEGDISLGAGNDEFLASGGVLDGSIFMGDGNDEVTLKDTLNTASIPQIDGGTGTDTLNLENISLRGFTAASNDATGNSSEQNNINLTGFETLNIKNKANLELTDNLFTSSNSGTVNLTDTSTLKIIQATTTPTTTTIYGDVNNNNSVINTSNQRLSDQLIIDGNYSGNNNATILLDTQLDGDKSPTDKFIINGSATGSTKLQVTKVGGAGAQTINGIHVIQTGSSESNQTFYLNGGAITVGAFDYLLHLKKQETTTDGTFDNWYLESKLTPPNPITPPTDIPVYTPDVGEYLAAETMGNTLFTSRLEDREGASQYQNLGDNDTGNVWIRAYGGHHQFKSMQDQLKTKGNSFVTQIGAGLVTLGEEDQYNLGAMGGVATYDGKTRSNLTSRESKTKINGYSLGLYGTWYAHPVEKRGAYIDSWVLWNKFKNKIDTADQNQYKYDSSGITASIEAGGDYLLNKNGKKDWWIQPQAQLIYQGVHADNFQDAQGVDINHGKDNLQARMGVKTYLNIPTDNNKLTSYRPYVALNFIHNTNPYSVEINDIRYENEGSANLGEFKLGVEGNVTKNSQVWLNASYVAGSHNNQSYQGNIGWKYNF